MKTIYQLAALAALLCAVTIAACMSAHRMPAMPGEPPTGSVEQADFLPPPAWYPAAGDQPGDYMQMYKQLTDQSQGPLKVSETVHIPAYLPQSSVGAWPAGLMVADYDGFIFFSLDGQSHVQEHIMVAMCLAGAVCADTQGGDCVGCPNGGASCTNWYCGAWHTDIDLTAGAIVTNEHSPFFMANVNDPVVLTVQTTGVQSGSHQFSLSAVDTPAGHQSTMALSVTYPFTYNRSAGHYLIATEQENTPGGGCVYPPSTFVDITSVQSATEPSATNPFSNWPNPVTNYTLTTLPKFSNEDCAQSAIVKRNTALASQWQLNY